MEMVWIIEEKILESVQISKINAIEWSNAIIPLDLKVYAGQLQKIIDTEHIYIAIKSNIVLVRSPLPKKLLMPTIGPQKNFTENLCD